MSRVVFIVVGEASGDILGAGLIREMRAASSEPIEFIGVGGPAMAAEGFETLMPMDELCVMGVFEVLGQITRLLRLISAMAEEIEKRDPDVVVTIDLPDFNFRVADKLKKRGIYQGKMVHYVAPSVWAWRPKRAEKIAALYDLVLCLLPMEPEYFKAEGLDSKYIGHPLVENASGYDALAFRTANDVSEGGRTLGLFLGSRMSEIHKHAPILVEAVEEILEKHPQIKIIIPTLPHLEYDVLEVLKDLSGEKIVVASLDLKWSAMAACDFAIAVSGTVALELSYINVPHVIAYKANILTWAIIKTMVKVKFAHLANILLEDDVVPEFLQWRCTSSAIADGVIDLMDNADAVNAQVNAFDGLKYKLGGNDAQSPSQKAAESVLAVMDSPYIEQNKTSD